MCLALADCIWSRVMPIEQHVFNVSKHTDIQSLTGGKAGGVQRRVWLDRFDRDTAERGTLQTLSRDLLMVASLALTVSGCLWR